MIHRGALEEGHDVDTDEDGDEGASGVVVQVDGVDGGRGRSPASRANLRTWSAGDPRAREAAMAGVAARARRAEARRLADSEPIGLLEAIASTVNREQLGPLAAAAAMWTIGEVVSGRQKVRDPAAWVRVLVDVARLEAGEVTSATATVQVTANDVARAVALRDAARRALGTGDDEDQDDDRAEVHHGA